MSSSVTSKSSQRNINADNSSADVIYEFESFRLDVGHRMLYSDDRPVALKPKVIETLVALIERRGEVISKEELMHRVWADTHVEE